MADPISITAVVATMIPFILGGVQTSLQLALDAMPEIHDTRNRYAMKKLLAFFYKARTGELTEKDFEQAKHYYFKLRAVALFAQNQTVLDDLENGMLLMEETLGVRHLIKSKTEIQPSDINTLASGLQACKALKSGDALVEAFRKYELPSYESISKPSAPLEAQKSHAAEKHSVKPRVWEKAATWSLVALIPPLLFVPKIRQKC
ncbi:hypothetical protein N7G274_009716 [Stereocaulon virgatum]|uniref:Uncharacterized protein n=1 Tax=Stereocaulon virgatum TaxID=373712 RepID=A0ABR3ZWA4_9LECA